MTPPAGVGKRPLYHPQFPQPYITYFPLDLDTPDLLWHLGPMRTVCVDGPRSGEIVTATGDSFRVPIPAKLPATIGAAAPEPLAPAYEYMTYQLMRLPYDKVPQTETGGVDYEKLSAGDGDLVRLLWDKAHYSLERRSWQFWSCAKV